MGGFRWDDDDDKIHALVYVCVYIMVLGETIGHGKKREKGGDIVEFKIRGKSLLSSLSLAFARNKIPARGVYIYFMRAAAALPLFLRRCWIKRKKPAAPTTAKTPTIKKNLPTPDMPSLLLDAL